MTSDIERARAKRLGERPHAPPCECPTCEQAEATKQERTLAEQLEASLALYAPKEPTR